jgi:hypothetical protein
MKTSLAFPELEQIKIVSGDGHCKNGCVIQSRSCPKRPIECPTLPQDNTFFFRRKCVLYSACRPTFGHWARGRRPWTSAHEPSESSLYEWLCVFLDADTMSDDQLLEIPRKQLFERSAREVSIDERKSNIDRNAAMRICNAR